MAKCQCRPDKYGTKPLIVAVNQLKQSFKIAHPNTVWVIDITTATIGTSVSAEEMWNCPSGEDARLAFISGEAKKWPNYSEGPGARVQRQHPDTALVPHAKFFDLGDRAFGVCQYYSHIGHTVTFGKVGLIKADIKKKSKFYWRKEFTESYSKDDKLGHEMMEVCMEKKKKLASPSIKCSFIIPD